jgi:hypothetical protein
MILRGVVTATYVVDDPNHPFATDSVRPPVAVYCDVFVYGQRQYMIINALVIQDRSGIHSGRIWKPRAAKIDIVTGTTPDYVGAANPVNLDGDHVLVEFLDGNANQPIITHCLPHPAADRGNETKTVGNRLKLVLADGDPDFAKHHGVFYGVNDAGDFVLDTTNAYAGDVLQPDGKEPVPAGSGASGNHHELLQAGATWDVKVGGNPTLAANGSAGAATFTVGDGAVAVAIAQALQLFLDSTIKPMFDNHIHTYIAPAIPGSPAPTLPPSTSTPPSIWTTYPTNITSTKVKIPDG